MTACLLTLLSFTLNTWQSVTAKLNQVGLNVRKTQSISLILTSPPPFVFYAAIKGGEESSETDLCPRSAAISVRSEIGPDKQAAELHCSQLCEDKDPSGSGLTPRSVAHIENELRKHSEGGDWSYTVKHRTGIRSKHKTLHSSDEFKHDVTHLIHNIM